MVILKYKSYLIIECVHIKKEFLHTKGRASQCSLDYTTDTTRKGSCMVNMHCSLNDRVGCFFTYPHICT